MEHDALLAGESQQEIESLCRRFKVRRLELFGSAARGGPGTEPNDLDFLVEFLPLEPGEHADCYFGLLFSLQELLRSPVDLVMGSAIQNRYFLKAIESDRKLLYAA